MDQVKRRILKLYEDDFLKIDPSGRASVMFRSIPGQLSRNAIRYVPYAAVGKVDDDKMTELLKALQDSKTVNMCYHVNDPQVGMGLSKNKDQFKMCPIEVKSSSSKSHASLDEFCRIYSSRILWRYLVYTKDFAKDQETIMLPAYMVPFL